MPIAGPSILDATRSYERWLASRTTVVKPDLARKHRFMAEAPFPFLRATYYRWAQLFPEICPKSAKSPKVLAVGDLHLENFGTWRDADGRFAWGINDFDEASILPYTNDLIRIATSAQLAIEADHLALSPRRAAEALLLGYTDSIRDGGRPFVLAEKNGWLRRVAAQQIGSPVQFWEKMSSWPSIRGSKVPAAALKELKKMLPDDKSEFRIVLRQAGLGSRGHQRFVALQNYCGGLVAREAKALVPSAAAWLNGNSQPIRYAEILNRTVRVLDPLFQVRGAWLVRRLAPDCRKIEIVNLPDEQNEERLLYCMGWETANVHLGTNGARQRIQRDLSRRPPNWLYKAATKMRDVINEDWKVWRRNYSRPSGR